VKRIDYEAHREKARRIAELAQELSKTKILMHNAATEARFAWRCEAAERYFTKFDKLCANIEPIKDKVASFSTAVESAVEIVRREDIEAEIMSSAQ